MIKVSLNRRRGRIATIFLAAAAPAAWAGDWTDHTSVHGFLSAQYSVTDRSELFQGSRADHGINDSGSARGTRLGLNITSEVSDKITVSGQLFSSQEDEHYATHLDWAFVRWRFNEAIAVRAGNIKYPVGLVNEYVRVGVAYPWIQAPVVIYSESTDGPQATRAGYSGADALWTRGTGNWIFDADLFGGQVNLAGMLITKLHGITARANWNDNLLLQASSYAGEMQPDNPTTMTGAMMDRKAHSATVLGAKLDWHRMLGYAEWALVDMDANANGVSIMDSRSWYGTLGYWLTENILPHFTYQHWRQGDGDGHDISTLGLVYSMTPDTRLKLEYSLIRTAGKGLFYSDATGTQTAPGGNTGMTAVSLDVVF